jgi:TetR/AcrR family transcriptional regulator, lmrAB and yxaGH operons repressor
MTQRAAAVPALAEAFREYGFEGASTAQLCAATGLGKGSLYNFFPGGKREMAAAVLADVDAWFTGSIFEPLRNALPGDPAAIFAMFEAVTAYFKSGRRICLQGAFALGRERDLFAETIAGYFERWIDSLAAALHTARRSDRGDRSDHSDGSDRGARAARLAAVEVIAAIQGGIVLSRALDNPEIFLQVIDRSRARLADGDLPGKTPP